MAPKSNGFAKAKAVAKAKAKAKARAQATPKELAAPDVVVEEPGSLVEKKQISAFLGVMKYRASDLCKDVEGKPDALRTLEVQQHLNML